MVFHPYDTELIVTGGKEHLNWWKLTENGTVLLLGKAHYGVRHRRRDSITSFAEVSSA